MFTITFFLDFYEAYFCKVLAGNIYCRAVVVAQLTERLLTTPEVRGLNLIEHLFAVLKEKRRI